MLIDTTNREPKTDPATDPGHGRHGIVPTAMQTERIITSLPLFSKWRKYGFDMRFAVGSQHRANNVSNPAERSLNHLVFTGRERGAGGHVLWSDGVSVHGQVGEGAVVFLHAKRRVRHAPFEARY